MWWLFKIIFREILPWALVFIFTILLYHAYKEKLCEYIDWVPGINCTDSKPAKIRSAVDAAETERRIHHSVSKQLERELKISEDRERRTEKVLRDAKDKPDSNEPIGESLRSYFCGVYEC